MRTTIAEPVPPKFMRPRKYAQRISVNWRTLYAYIEEGVLPAYKFQGVVLLDIDECDNIIKGLARSVLPVAPAKRKRRLEL